MDNNRRVIEFWNDSWIEARPLYESTQSYVGQQQVKLKVTDYWQDGVGWRWDWIDHQLLARTLMNLTSKVLNADSSEMDEFEGAPSCNGKFNVKDAYCLVKAWVEEKEWERWRRIWRMKTQQPVRVFV